MAKRPPYLQAPDKITIPPLPNNSLDQRDSSPTLSAENACGEVIPFVIGQSRPIRYEWKCIRLSAHVEEHDNGINAGCADGWELFQVYVSIESKPRLCGETVISHTMALFRRPRAERSEPPSAPENDTVKKGAC
jgi:hypothetical protein